MALKCKRCCFQVSMMSAVSGTGDQMLRRVKQEAEPPPQYSPTEQPLAPLLHPRNNMLMQPVVS